MSGPPYPYPVPGSNAIGSFTIGVSPIGTMSSFNPWTTIISQYANSPIIDGLIVNYADALDPTKNFDLFYDRMWNLDTAEGYGLDVWGRIVGVSRTIKLFQGQFFGYEEAVDGGGIGTFGESIFYSGNNIVVDNIVLDDSQFRLLIDAKALANISDCSIPSINQILLTLFPGRGNCYVTDNQDMTLTYTFDFNLTDVEFAIIIETGVLPRPAGIRAGVKQPPG